MLVFEKDTEGNEYLEFAEFLHLFKIPMVKNVSLLVELLVFMGV